MQQAADDRSVTEDRPEQLTGHQLLVTSHQTELARCAFLLTSDEPSATQLAIETLLSYFASHDPDQPSDQQRIELLSTLAQRYLDDDRQLVSAKPVPSTSRTTSQRYHVDDERSKLLGFLNRLGPMDRLTLVLRDYAHLEDEIVARALDIQPYQLAERLPPIRNRLRQTVSTSDDISTRSLLDQAAGTTPRPQLWPLIAEPLAEQERERRRRQQRLTWLVAAGVALLLILGSVWLIAGFRWLTGSDDDGEVAAEAVATSSPVASPTVTPTPEPTPTPVPPVSSLNIPQADVPSIMRIDPYPAQTSQEPHNEVFSYDLANNELTQLSTELEGVDRRLISPDGRWILGQVRGELGGPLQRILMIDTQTRDVLWSTEVREDRQFVSFACAGNRLYALDAEPPGSLAIFDIQTGKALSNREGLFEELGVSTISSTGRHAEIFVTPDGRQLWLYLIREQNWTVGQSPTYVMWSLSSYNLPNPDMPHGNDLPDLTLLSQNQITTITEDGQLPEQYVINRPIWTPDGSHLVTVFDSGGGLLFSSPVPEQQMGLSLPFAPAAERSPDDLILVPSNTGRLLYVIATARREVAVVDLLKREVLRVAPIDANGFTIEPVLDNRGRPSFGEAFFSPDGSRLYIANAWSATGSLWSGPHDKPLTVIDTTLWKVVDQLDAEGQIWGLYPIESGKFVATLHSAPIDDPSTVNRSIKFSVFDTQSGEYAWIYRRSMDIIDFPDWVANFGVSMPYTLYRQTYGRSLAVDGVDFVDSQTDSSRPRVRLTTENDVIPAGVPFTFELHVNDPVTGELLTALREGVRFDPNSIASVTLHHAVEQIQSNLIILSHDSDGVYRGTTTLPAAGVWNADVTFVAPTGRIWSATLGRVLASTESLEGTDGNLYIAVSQTEPQVPEPNAPVTFTVSFIDAISRKPLPDGVDLKDGLPEVVDVLLNAPDSGFRIVHLQLVGHGIYQGEGEFWGAGRWAIQLRFQYPETRRYVYLQAGIVTVGGR